MNDADHLAALAAADAVLTGARAADLASPVPSCPGWTVEDLLEHLTQVQRWATRIVTAPPGERVARRVEESPTGPALLDFVQLGAAELEATLAEVDLDHAVYSFVGTRPARWWLRRQAHEATVHAWDLADATGTALTLDADVAVDGIDELLEVYLDPRLIDTEGFAAGGESLHVHTTDVDGEWMVRVASGSISVTREHAKGDLAVRGPAADVLLALWGRRALDDGAVEVFGDAGVLGRLRAAAPL
jgi:uncharacterized protein (TIGR03083 family)